MSLRGSATHRSCAHHGVAKKHDVVDVRQEGRRQIHTIVVHSSGTDAGEGQAKDKPMGGERVGVPSGLSGVPDTSQDCRDQISGITCCCSRTLLSRRV